MGTLTRTLLAFFGGILVMQLFMTWKSGKGFYHFATFPRFTAPETAGDLLRRLNKAPEPGTSDLSWKAAVLREFLQDLERMKWTWNGEIEWRTTDRK